MSINSPMDVSVLSKKYADQQERVVRIRANKAFRILLICEWFFGIIVAFFVSPKTWSGEMSETHIHIWASILLGGAILLPPIVLVTKDCSSKIAPYIIACSQMLFGSLLIHLMAGRIEAHFYIFGSLAFLSTYRDWKILIPATVIVAVDHIVRGVYWPQSAYGVLTGAEWRWLEHAGWVIFEDIFLVISIVQGKQDIHDIAEKRAELETRNSRVETLVKNLQDKQAQLVQSAKLASLGEMSSGLAHELNNPLHFINGFNNRIKKIISDSDSKGMEKLESYSKKISENCERMRKIINHFREFSRQSDHKLEPVFAEEIIERSLILLNDQLKSRNIKVEKKLCTQSHEILGDVTRLEQVIINLVTNARDAVEGNNCQSVISISSYYEDGEWFVIEVKDNGSGIPEDVEKNIFNPFFTTKDVGKGTGLGLSISHGIIEEHGGRLSCTSVVSIGTSFFIRLPFRENSTKKTA